MLLSPLPLTKGLAAPWDAVCHSTCVFTLGSIALLVLVIRLFSIRFFKGSHLPLRTLSSDSPEQMHWYPFERDVPRTMKTSKGAKKTGAEGSTHYLCSKSVCLLLAVQAHSGREVSLGRL